VRGGPAGSAGAVQAPVLFLPLKNAGFILGTMILNIMVKIRTGSISINSSYHWTKKDSKNHPTKSQFHYADHIHNQLKFSGFFLVASDLAYYDYRHPRPPHLVTFNFYHDMPLKVIFLS
jgi:hypothetical protein